MATNLDATLDERGSRYGEFLGNAVIAQELKLCARSFEGWEKLEPDMCEALDMIFHKIARILNGDPRYPDSWHDIAGYAQLIEKTLTDKEETAVGEGYAYVTDKEGNLFAAYDPVANRWVWM